MKRMEYYLYGSKSVQLATMHIHLVVVTRRQATGSSTTSTTSVSVVPELHKIE
jgi:hypothetical protein